MRGIMRALAGTFGTVLVLGLALLLAGSTPFGTGAGSHRHQILHPALPHAHPGEHEETAHTHEHASAAGYGSVFEDHSRGPSVGAGAGAAGSAAGIAITPPVPVGGALRVRVSLPPRSVTTDVGLPASREESPPVPPPLQAA